MPDYRSRRQKLEDMADDTSSPNEAKEAQRRLIIENMAAKGYPDFEFVNKYGDIIYANIPALGGWLPLFTSNHFADDDPHRLEDGKEG